MSIDRARVLGRLYRIFRRIPWNSGKAAPYLGRRCANSGPPDWRSIAREMRGHLRIPGDSRALQSGALLPLRCDQDHIPHLMAAFSGFPVRPSRPPCRNGALWREERRPSGSPRGIAAWEAGGIVPTGIKPAGRKPSGDKQARGNGRGNTRGEEWMGDSRGSAI